jgi:hypothetical protein
MKTRHDQWKGGNHDFIARMWTGRGKNPDP